MLDYSLKIVQDGTNEIIMNIYKNKEIVLSARNRSIIQEEISCIDLIPFLTDPNLEFEIYLNDGYSEANKNLINENEKIILKIKDSVPYFYFPDKKITGRYYLDCLDFYDVITFYGIKGYKEKI